MNTQKERPILFSGAMVRAILEGRKTQTRRVIKPQPQQYTHQDGHESIRWRHNVHTPLVIAPDVLSRMCPYGAPGDTLWLRETHTANAFGETLYKADWDAQGYESEGMGWKPSIHMPRWASRITLEVTGVRVERVQDISGEDAVAEGIAPDMETHAGQYWRENAVDAFRVLWDSINKKRGYGWNSNPWVWVVEFRRVQP